MCDPKIISKCVPALINWTFF